MCVYFQSPEGQKGNSEVCVIPNYEVAAGAGTITHLRSAPGRKPRKLTQAHDAFHTSRNTPAPIQAGT